MRRRLSYANVVATLALVFAMSGGALAANHYLINSTKQINPKVLKKLKGAQGASGAAGATGAAGTGGAQGKEGSPGKEGLTGKEGKEGKVGKEGPEGKEGSKGEAGSARAYAAVSSTGTLDVARSKNIESATTSGAGIYCLKLTAAVPVSTTAPVATIDITGGGWSPPATASVETIPGECAGENRIEVVTRQPNGATTDANKAEPFTVVVP